MSTRPVTSCDLCGLEAVEPAVRFVIGIDVCKACAERPITELVPLLGSIRGQILSSPLSPREHDVLTLLAEGLSVPEVARRLYLSDSSVRTYVYRLYRKLGVTTKSQAMIAAVRGGLI